MGRTIDIDTKEFKYGYWKGENAEYVVFEDPDYLPYLLTSDTLKYELENEERELLQTILDMSIE